MGTRSLTRVMDEGKEILCVYRQNDGYPTGHGQDLLDAFKGFKITNGISGDTTKTANGMGCFAAQLVYVLKGARNTLGAQKDGPTVGSIYIYPPGTTDAWQEYEYVISQAGDQLRLKVIAGQEHDGGVMIYDGLLDKFNPAKVEKKAEEV